MNTAGKAASQQISKRDTPVSVVLLMHTVASHRDHTEYWAVGHQLIHHRNPYDSKAILRMIDPTETRKNRVLRNPPSALFITRR